MTLVYGEFPESVGGCYGSTASPESIGPYRHTSRFVGTFRGKGMEAVQPVVELLREIGGRYSNRIRATKFNPGGNVRKHPNLQKKRIFVPELNRTITLTLSTSAIKTIHKNGAYATLKKAGLI